MILSTKIADKFGDILADNNYNENNETMMDAIDEIKEKVAKIYADSPKKKQFFISKKLYFKLYAELAEKFPKLFSLDKKLPRKPLKIGIKEDIKQRGEWNKKYGLFLYRYTRSQKYIKVHQVGADRYDLDGNVAGCVTQEEFDSKLNMKKTAAANIS